jgi:hypothetical protein
MILGGSSRQLHPDRRARSRCTSTAGALIAVLLFTAGSPVTATLAFGPNYCVDSGLNPEHREPSVVCTPAGRVYAAYCERSEASLNPEQIRITWSDDRGRVWSQPAVRVNDTEPKSAMTPCIGLAPDGTLMLTWVEWRFEDLSTQIRFSSSVDGGLHWSPSAVVHPLNPIESHGEPSILPLPSRILISYLWRASGGPKLAVMTMSDDGGVTWSPPAIVSPMQLGNSSPPSVLAWNRRTATVGILLSSLDRKLFVRRSTDRGDNWSDPVQASDDWDAEYASFAAGESFHVVWTATHGDSRTNIYYSRSADGASFSSATRLSNDWVQGQYEPHIDAGDDSDIHICWTAQTSPAAHDLLYLRSTDDGATWPGPCLRVNDIAFAVSPRVPHTSAVAADPAGNPICLWNDERAGGNYPHVYCSSAEDPSSVDDRSGGDPTALHVSLAAHPGPAPRLRLDLTRATPWMSFELFDSGGRRVSESLVGEQAGGTYEISLSRAMGGEMPGAGVYFLRVRAQREAGRIRVVSLR